MTTPTKARTPSSNASSYKSTISGKSDASDRSLNVVRHFTAQVAKQGRQIEDLQRDLIQERTNTQVTQRMVLNLEEKTHGLMLAHQGAVWCITQLQHLVNQLFMEKINVLPPPPPRPKESLKRTKSL